MKPLRLLTAVIVLAVLGAAIWWTNKHPSVDATKKDPTTQKLVPLSGADDVTAIAIDKQGSDPVAVAKTSGKWAVTKPTPLPADQDAASMLVSSIQTLTWDRVVDEHPTDLAAFGLNNSPLQVAVTLKNGKTTKVIWGSDTPAGTDSYAKIDGDPKVYTTPIYTKTGFEKTVNDLRDKQLLTFDQDKMTAFTMTTKNGVIEFGKNAQGDWQLTKPKPFRSDGTLVDDVVRKLKDARMDLTSANADPATAAKEFAAGDKTGIATVTDNSGTETLEIHKSKNGSYYAKSSAVPGVYKLAGEIGDSFGKTADDYRNKKLFDFGFMDPTRLDLNGKGYLKGEDRWLVGSAAFDAASVQSVVDKLRDFAATGFAEKSAGAPVLVVAVTYGDKHRVEKVTFYRDADKWLAQRDDDPTVYTVDSKSVDDLQKDIAAIKPYQAPKKK
jgi:hypothetical protein